MAVEQNRQSNIDRFLGFQELYDNHRPEAPVKVVDLLTGYLGRQPGLVVDVGCGTGLSTFIWQGRADRIIGIEPNPDMLAKAEAKQRMGIGDAEDLQPISFMQGYSNLLPLDNETADIITCSQSFHWMEPGSTLREFVRVLRPRGVFAAYDCDWPPVTGWEAEAAYQRLIAKSEQLLHRLVKPDDAAVKLDKEGHLGRIQDSGCFRYTRELVFHHEQSCTAERLVGLALSQGGIQTVLKLGAAEELAGELEEFRSLLEQRFGGKTAETLFCYRLRLGVK